MFSVLRAMRNAAQISALDSPACTRRSVTMSVKESSLPLGALFSRFFHSDRHDCGLESCALSMRCSRSVNLRVIAQPLPNSDGILFHPRRAHEISETVAGLN